MTRQRALRLAREWSQGHVCSLRNGEAEEYHAMFVAMLEKSMPNEPLTLEQLREMDGKPVYCGDRKEWGIIHIDPDGMWANIPFFRGVYCDLDVQHNGLTLYAYQPAHIYMDCGKDTNVPTNADCIRAMSDEELAKHIWKKFGCPPWKDHITCGYVGDCKDCWLEWLRQPAEED